MAAKELIEARGKALIGAALVLVVSVLLAGSYEWVRSLIANLNSSQMPPGLADQLQQSLGLFDIYVWSQWFPKTGGMILAALAAFLGGALVAGEVSKGTIYFLLSKPVSRERVLATKYATGAGILLALSLIGGVGLYASAALLGHPQPLGGVLLSTVLLWLGVLSIFGVALLFSVVFDDVLPPVGLAILVGVVVGLPGVIGGFVPGWADWSLPNYWASLPAYLETGFPAKEIVVCLVAAALPLALAVPLFRKRAY